MFGFPRAFAQRKKDEPPVPKKHVLTYTSLVKLEERNYLCQGNEQNQGAKMKTNVFSQKREGREKGEGNGERERH